jgi:hypothetical protein
MTKCALAPCQQRRKNCHVTIQLAETQCRKRLPRLSNAVEFGDISRSRGGPAFICQSHFPSMLSAM